jgi:glucokinase
MSANSLAARFAAVDIGGTKIAGAIGTLDGRLLATARIDTSGMRGADDVLQRVAGLIRELEKETGPAEAIGVGVPGLIDSRGVAQFLPNLPGHWTGVPVTETLTRLTGHACYALNDARMATLGEFVFGEGRKSQRMLLVTVGTGIGGGLVLDGRLQSGLHGGAGEVGHQTILPDGPLCTCGSRGCLETLASGPAVTAAARELIGRGQAHELKTFADDGSLNPRHIADAAADGNPACIALLNRTGEFLGIGIANAVTITAVDTIVLTGGLAALGDWLLKPIRATLADRVRMFPTTGIRVMLSKLGGDAALLGAIALAARHPSTEQL